MFPFMWNLQFHWFTLTYKLGTVKVLFLNMVGNKSPTSEAQVTPSSHKLKTKC